MSAAEVMSMVLGRLDYLLQFDEASSTYIHFSRANVLDLREKLATLRTTEDVSNPDWYRDYIRKRLVELAYDVENTVEYLLVVPPIPLSRWRRFSKRPAVAVVVTLAGTTTLHDLLKRIQHEKELDESSMKYACTESDEPREISTISQEYGSLPVLAKLCLVYLGLFPPSQPIPLEKLYLLWISEGLVRNIHEARQCMDDLANRKLVQLQEEHGIQSCLPRDLINVFCYPKPDNIFEKHMADLHLKPNKLSGRLWYSSSFLSRHRALLIFGIDMVDPQIKISEPYLEKDDEVADFKQAKWMRTLDFNAIDFGRKDNEFLQSIDELTCLRYLGFKDCYLDELPLSCSNFPFLETLDLRARTSCIRTMIIPDVICKLTRLRRLYFPKAYQTCHDKQQKKKLSLSGLIELEILVNFHPGVCDVYDLKQMKKIQDFTVTAGGACFADLVELLDLPYVKSGYYNDTEGRYHVSWITWLNHFKVSISSLTLLNYNCYSSQRLNLLERLLECGAKALYLEGQMKRVPGDLKQLTKIVFDGCKLLDPIPELGELPCLKSLVLCNNAIFGREICCPSSSFSELTSLKMTNLQSLEKWVVEGGAMSKLSVVTIELCPKLQMLPDKRLALPSLKKIEIGSMPKQFEDNVLNMLRGSGKGGCKLLKLVWLGLKRPRREPVSVSNIQL